MSQEVVQNELPEKTRQLMDGPLKHIRAAALAAALVPLASVLATPASAQSATCGSGGVCGFVFNDTNSNGIQEAGEPGIEGAKVTIYANDGSLVGETETDAGGFYYFGAPGVVTVGNTYTVAVLVGGELQGMQASPSNVGDDTLDSDGTVIDGFSVATVTLAGSSNPDTDFGFHKSAALNPGTGTPGYWKNHPEAWPVGGITIGTNNYTKAQAIAWLGKVGKDKSTTIFASYVSAYLNGLIGNTTSCVSVAMSSAYAWLSAHPVGSQIAGSSAEWQAIEGSHQALDAYNNGQLCAPHRQ